MRSGAPCSGVTPEPRALRCFGGVDDAEVLIVGAGPAGLVAGIALSRYGVNTVVVEKRTALSTLSRATVISTRCMEIFRSWDLEDAIRAGAADVETVAGSRRLWHLGKE